MRGRPKIDNPKTEVLQLRLTPEEKEMLFNAKEMYDFDSVAEMILFFVKLKMEKQKN